MYKYNLNLGYNKALSKLNRSFKGIFSTLAVGTLLFTTQLQATTLNLKSGWNLVGSNQNNIDINTTIPNANIVWRYKANNWYATSPNGTTTTALKNKGIKKRYNYV